GQCLTRFVVSAPPPPPPPSSIAPVRATENQLPGVIEDDESPFDRIRPSQGAQEAPPAFRATGEAGAVRVDEDGISWTCVRCDTVNEFAANVCVVCGAKFAESIRPPEEPRPSRDPNKTALISLFMPGAGHAYLGIWGEAFARAVISTWVVLVAVFAAAQNVAQAKIMGVLFALVATALWVVAAHDSYREALGMPSAVILKKKFFLGLVLGLLMLSIVMVFSIVMGARN
ncbi:MAG: hypothetical protein M3198_08405, partial [Actinomycetota bacterium]|nr:hypothetical protein [Actinomycetota bacterium]